MVQEQQDPRETGCDTAPRDSPPPRLVLGPRAASIRGRATVAAAALVEQDEEIEEEEEGGNVPPAASDTASKLQQGGCSAFQRMRCMMHLRAGGKGNGMIHDGRAGGRGRTVRGRSSKPKPSATTTLPAAAASGGPPGSRSPDLRDPASYRSFAGMPAGAPVPTLGMPYHPGLAQQQQQYHWWGPSEAAVPAGIPYPQGQYWGTSPAAPLPRVTGWSPWLLGSLPAAAWEAYTPLGKHLGPTYGSHSDGSRQEQMGGLLARISAAAGQQQDAATVGGQHKDTQPEDMADAGTPGPGAALQPPGAAGDSHSAASWHHSMMHQAPQVCFVQGAHTEGAPFCVPGTR